MSGIVGIWNIDGRPVDRCVLARMSATLAHRGPDGERIWVNGAMGVACQLFRVTPEAQREVQPLVSGDGLVLVWDGRLDNRDDLLRLLEPSAPVSAESPDPDLALTAYRRWGAAFAEYLNGDFAVAVLDGTHQQILLARDALGVRPLHYCHTGRAIVFASEIKALLAHAGISG